VDPAADDPRTARLAATSTNAGLLYGRRLNRLVRPNDVIAKVAGTQVLADSGRY
jgi:hypothetical protein